MLAVRVNWGTHLIKPIVSLQTRNLFSTSPYHLNVILTQHQYHCILVTIMCLLAASETTILITNLLTSCLYCLMMLSTKF